MFPFEEKSVDKQVKIRTFKSSTDNEELIWHRDVEDRSVRVLQGEGWYFQREDELPVKLNPGDVHAIKKCTWHRIIRKRVCSNLVVEVTCL
jgi:hypothetical protein